MATLSSSIHIYDYLKIPDFEDYGCTEDGKILSLSCRGHNYYRDRIKELAAAKNPSGYMQVALCKDAKLYSFPVHKLIALTWIGPRQDGMEINHIDGNKMNNHASNLEYISHTENIRHAWKSGLRDGVKAKASEKMRGEKSYAAKLTDKQFEEIMSELKSGAKQKYLAEKYGIHQSTISHYASGKRRKLFIEHKEV